MAKLYFRYGAMNSGKSTALLQAAFNYEERGQRVVLAKPASDTKGLDRIVSRLGVYRDVDLIIGVAADLRAAFHAHGGGATSEVIPPVACLLVDEAQFLTPHQVEDLLRIAVVDRVPVLTYGIRTDFQTRSFPGSASNMDLAHSLEELKTICRCGDKALFNTRRRDGEIIFDGEQIAIDGEDISYESLCARCYLQVSGGRLG